jgi:hypothetical protein
MTRRVPRSDKAHDLERKSQQEDLRLEVSTRGVVVASGCYSADYVRAMSKLLGGRGDMPPGGYAFSEADLPAIRSELALAAYERRREMRPLLEVLRRGEATPAIQQVVAELLDSAKGLPSRRSSKWRSRAIAVDVDQLRTGGVKAGAAHRKVATDYSVSLSTVESAVRSEREWLAERKAQLSPGTQLCVWL